MHPPAADDQGAKTKGRKHYAEKTACRVGQEHPKEHPKEQPKESFN